MVERSLSSFPKFLSEGLGHLVSPGSQSKSLSTSIGKGFETFIHTVNRYRSKYEEEQIVQKELSLLQQKITSSDVTQVQMREYLCCAIYCGIMGYDVSFACIHAVKLAQQGSLVEKRIGYLTASLLLHPGHELVLLLVNTIQKDLKSSNILDNCMALTAACQLIGSEMIPALLPLVLEKLKHNRELVRQKAVMCLHRFKLLAPDLLIHVQTDLERALYDKDPAVMAAAVNIVSSSTEEAPENCLHLVDTLVSIMRQVLSRKMSDMFEFHSIPFPWLQIKILYCLGNIAAVDERTATKLSPLLIEVLQRASAKENIAYGLIYQCLTCVSAIKPSRQLMEEASKHVGRFLRSQDSNLRYVGVKALIGLVKVDPSFVMDYQSLIVDSLEHSEQSMQRKMYKLLYQIANPTNVEVITVKLLNQLEISLDKFWRSEVVTMVMDLAIRFEPSLTWPFDTKLKCLQLGGDNMTLAMVESVINDLKTGLTSSKLEMKQFLVKKCVECLMADKTHPNVIHVTAWVLAELSSLLTKLPEDRVLSLYTRHLCKPDLPDHVKASMITGLQKLICDDVVSSEAMVTGISQCLKCKQALLIRQRLNLLHQMCKQGTKITLCRDPDQFDFTLSFLDSYVCQCMEQGASPYKPRHLRFGARDNDQSTHLSIDTGVGTIPGRAETGSVYSSSHYKSQSSTSSGILKDETEIKLDMRGVKRVWGKQGIISKTQDTKQMDLHSEVASGNTEQSSHRQKMAVALFGGLQPMYKAREASESATQLTFGGCDQDSAMNLPASVMLPTSDTAGWRKFHKVQTEVSDSGATRTGQIAFEDVNSEHIIQEDESQLINHEDKTSCDTLVKDMADFDTGYESKIKYENHMDNQGILDENLKMVQNLNLSYVNNENKFISSNVSHNDGMSIVKSVGSENSLNTNNVPVDDLENMSDKTASSASLKEQSTDDLDEALAMLLNDSLSFVNISTVSSDQESAQDSNEGACGIKIRESVYTIKKSELDSGQDGQMEIESKIGSLYDDVDDDDLEQ